MENHDIESAIEGILFVSGEPVKLARLAAVLGVDELIVEESADKLRDKYSFERRGIRLIRLDNAIQLCSSPELADVIRRALETRKPPQMSTASLEVLAVVAYFQPVTKAYIEKIRGVDSSYTVGILVERGLIESCGRLDAPGRPMLYKTTYVFLRTFGMQSLSELPALPQAESTGDREGIQNAILELKSKEAEAAETAESAENASEEPDITEEQETAEKPDITEKPEED